MALAQAGGLGAQGEARRVRRLDVQVDGPAALRSCVDEGERAHGMVPHRRWRSSAERAHGPAKSASCHDLEWGTVRSRQSFCVCRLMVLKRQRLNLTLQARLGVHQVSMNLWFLVRSRCTS